MKSALAPTLVQDVGDNYILWFKPSNKYVVIEESLFNLLQLFLSSKDDNAFKATLLDLSFDSNKVDVIGNEISIFLKECNLNREEQKPSSISFKNTNRNITHYYQFDGVTITIHYDSDKTESLIHPQLEHALLSKSNQKSDFIFDIFLQDKTFCLFKDEASVGEFEEKDYHLLQGKFAMHLLCSLTNTLESDWLGTFHASTVEHNNKAVMIVGDSGSGKSTFTALLLANKFNVLADDITPILAKDNKVYKYPGGISIKSGAFNLLESTFPNFNTLPLHYINQYKGNVKYVSPTTDKSNFAKGFPCQVMVCINYQKGAQTNLERISTDEALQIVIPESWISPQLEHAKLFLNWIKNIKFYRLTYSDYDKAIEEFSNLFQ